jgi:hypothetical protein
MYVLFGLPCKVHVFGKKGRNFREAQLLNEQLNFLLLSKYV